MSTGSIWHALHAFGEQGGWPLTMFLDARRRAVLGRHLFPRYAALRPAELPPNPHRDRAPLESRARQDRRQPRPYREAVQQAAADEASGRLSRSSSTRRRRLLPRPSTPRMAASAAPPNSPDPPSSNSSGGSTGAPATALPPGRRHHPRPISARAASTTISAAALPATASMPVGWCRISRRCCMTMLSCCVCSAA